MINVLAFIFGVGLGFILAVIFLGLSRLKKALYDAAALQSRTPEFNEDVMRQYKKRMGLD